MSDFSAGRYILRFPDPLRDIDPEFLDRWVLPLLQEDGSLSLADDLDLSPLARFDSDLPENTPEKLRAILDFTPEPLTRAEEEALLADPEAPDRVNRVFAACLPAVLSLAMALSPPEEELPLLLADGLEELLDAIGSYVPGTHGGFRGYALWHVRCRLIRSLWDEHPENPGAGSGALFPEFRLRRPENAFVSPADAPVPRAAVSSGSTALLYRKLRRENPELFQAVLEQLHPREVQVLEMLLEEGCLYTLWDAADRFQVTYRRIWEVLRRFHRRARRALTAENRSMRIKEFISS